MIRENELRLLCLQRKMLTITKDNTDTRNGISKVLQGVQASSVCIHINQNKHGNNIKDLMMRWT